MDIDLGDVRAFAQNMKAKYALFQRLEETITLIEQAAGLQKEKEAAIVGLDEEIKERTSVLSELKNTVNNLQDKVNTMTASYKRKSVELDTAYQETRKRQAAEMKEGENQLQLARSSAKAEMQKLDSDKKALESNIASLQKKLSDIRSSISI